MILSVPKRLCKNSLLFVALLPIALIFLPWLGLLNPQSTIDLQQITEFAAQERTREIVRKSFSIALSSAALSLALGGLLHFLLQQTRFQKTWLILFCIPLLLSPYTFVQGWIHWLGDQGTLTRNLFPSQPYTLSSRSGLCGMLALHFFPWALLLLHLGHRPLARNEKEFCQLTSLHWLQRFRLLAWPRLILPSVIAFLWITLQAFWSYDIPSMLRQNLISLELMAAFGSFYDLNRALAVLLNTWPIALLPLLLIVILLAQRTHLKRLLEYEAQPLRNLSWKEGLAALLALALLLIPLSGLLFQITSLPSLARIYENARGDFGNTLHYAFLASLFSGLLTIPLLLTPKKTRLLLSSILILALIVPSSLQGILWLGITSLDFWPSFLQDQPSLIILLTAFLLPYTVLLSIVFFPAPARARQDLARMTPHPLRLHWQQALRLKRPPFAWLLLIVSLISIREVPLILLHYPPEGGTLALTIETMLHFDQPELVAGLSLCQLLATGILVTAFSLLAFSPK